MPKHKSEKSPRQNPSLLIVHLGCIENSIKGLDTILDYIPDAGAHQLQADLKAHIAEYRAYIIRLSSQGVTR